MDFEQIKMAVSGVSPWLAIIDISLVAILLYRVYLLLRNTRAMALFNGILILIGFAWLFRWSNLHAISWILENLLQTLLFALVVVFQPELRRALEHIGRHLNFNFGKKGSLDKKAVEQLLDAVADATEIMSKNKVGALMVFQRNVGLQERVETGVPIEGLVSSALLQQIFVKDTPLHDGAAIIEGERILAASCLLPVSENRNLSRALGTRHRAAVGMSEQSDALVLIVSEETGVISIARNGQIFRNLSLEDVKGMLRDKIYESQLNLKEAARNFVKEKYHYLTEKNTTKEGKK